MSRLKQILKKHCPSMDEIFLDDERRAFRKRILDAMEEYATECAKASLDKASEKPKLIITDLLDANYKQKTLFTFFEKDLYGNTERVVNVDKSSITHPENITLL